MDQQTKGAGYGKRPVWQWIVIYLVVAAIAYGLIYYFFFASKGGYQAGTPSTTGNESPQAPAPYTY